MYVEPVAPEEEEEEAAEGGLGGDDGGSAASSRRELVDRLRGVKIFEALGVEQLKQLVGAMVEVQVAQNAWLYQEGEVGRALYAVEQGSGAVLKAITRGRDAGKHETLAVLEQWSLFGERGLLKDEVRPSGVRSTSEPLSLLMLTRERFEDVLGLPLQEIITDQAYDVTKAKLRKAERRNVRAAAAASSEEAAGAASTAGVAADGTQDAAAAELEGDCGLGDDEMMPPCNDDRVYVVSGTKPLIVRSGRSLDSEFVCQLPVGTELKLLSVDDANEDADVRALVRLEGSSSAALALLGSSDDETIEFDPRDFYGHNAARMLSGPAAWLPTPLTTARSSFASVDGSVRGRSPLPSARTPLPSARTPRSPMPSSRLGSARSASMGSPRQGFSPRLPARTWSSPWHGTANRHGVAPGRAAHGSTPREALSERRSRGAANDEVLRPTTAPPPPVAPIAAAAAAAAGRVSARGSGCRKSARTTSPRRPPSSPNVSQPLPASSPRAPVQPPLSARGKGRTTLLGVQTATAPSAATPRGAPPHGLGSAPTPRATFLPTLQVTERHRLSSRNTEQQQEEEVVVVEEEEDASQQEKQDQGWFGGLMWWRTGPAPSAQSEADLLSAFPGGAGTSTITSGNQAATDQDGGRAVAETRAAAPSNAPNATASADAYASASSPETAQGIGWITIKKDGVTRINPRLTGMDTARRELQRRSWHRRTSDDRGDDARRTPRSATLMNPVRDMALKKMLREVDSSTDRHAKSMFRAAIASDLQDGIGFAFGGVMPGRLHAHGVPVESHQVLYSVAKCGRYRLHVGLRKQVVGGKVVASVALPGSPFELLVEPGAAHALASFVPKDQLPLSGLVGFKADGGSSSSSNNPSPDTAAESGGALAGASPALCGCRLFLPVSDRMGNPCVRGGANVRASASDDNVESAVEDRGDGTYMVEWHSRLSGCFNVSIDIDERPIGGVPFAITFLSGGPELPFTTATGDGLASAVVGTPTTFLLTFRDRFENPARLQRENFLVAMALVPAPQAGEKGQSEKQERAKQQHQQRSAKDKDKDSSFKTRDKDLWRQAPAHSAVWLAYGAAAIEVKYTAEAAGDMELHCWCQRGPNGAGAPREALPGSPFRVVCAPGKACAKTSIVGGFHRVHSSKDRGGKDGGDQGKGGKGRKRSKKLSAKEAEEEAARELEMEKALKEAERAAEEALKKEEAARFRRRSRESRESRESMGSAGAPAEEETQPPPPAGPPVLAGELIQVRMLIRDAYKNPAAVPAGALKVTLELPSGERTPLTPEWHERGGLEACELIRYEPQLTGDYSMHLHLDGEVMHGSPLVFHTVPAQPDVSRSILSPPDEAVVGAQPFFAGQPYQLTVQGVDRYGNAIERGGAHVVARLVAVGSLPLTPSQETSFEAEDMDDGSYTITMVLKGPAEVKVIVGLHQSAEAMSNEKAYLAATDFPPLLFTFTKSKEQLEAEAKRVAEEKETEERKKRQREYAEQMKRNMQAVAAGDQAAMKAHAPGMASPTASSSFHSDRSAASASVRSDRSGKRRWPRARAVLAAGLAAAPAATSATADGSKLEDPVEVAASREVRGAIREEAATARGAAEAAMSDEERMAARLQRAFRVRAAKSELELRRRERVGGIEKQQLDQTDQLEEEELVLLHAEERRDDQALVATTSATARVPVPPLPAASMATPGPSVEQTKPALAPSSSRGCSARDGASSSATTTPRAAGPRHLARGQSSARAARAAGEATSRSGRAETTLRSSYSAAAGPGLGHSRAASPFGTHGGTPCEAHPAAVEAVPPRAAGKGGVSMSSQSKGGATKEAPLMTSSELATMADELLRRSQQELVKLDETKTLAARLGVVLVAKNIKVAELVATWAKRGEDEINKFEFRQHVRKLVKCEAVEVDALFDELDVDSDGQLDTGEMRESFGKFRDAAKSMSLRESSVREVGSRLQQRAHAAQAAAKMMTEVEGLLAEIEESRAMERSGKLPLRERLGMTLATKNLKTNELVLKWDDSGNGLIEKSEFRKHVAILMGVEKDADKAAPGGEIDQLFDELDEDKGGFLDDSEIKQALRTLMDMAKDEVQVRKGKEKRYKVQVEGARTAQGELLRALNADAAEEEKEAERARLEAEERMAAAAVDVAAKVAAEAKKKAAVAAKKAAFDAKVAAKRKARAQ